MEMAWREAQRKAVYDGVVCILVCQSCVLPTLEDEEDKASKASCHDFMEDQCDSHSHQQAGTEG